MTCKQLGGACEEKFSAATFEEIAEMAKKHGIEMFQQADAEHLMAMARIKDLMQDPDAMREWLENKKKEFESLPDD